MFILQTKNISGFSRVLFGLFVFTSLLSVQQVNGQSDFISSQYINTQLMINPAYAGVRNSLRVDVLSRQQWMGVKDAPSTYLLSAHSPLNKRMANIGGSLLHYQNGPIQQNELNMVYSYLLRVNHRMFLSLGLNASLSHYSIGLSALDIIEDGDPGFTNNIENAFKPDFGIGAFLFTPDFYVGLSAPNVIVNKLKAGDEKTIILEQSRNIYLTSGYAFDMGNDFYLKPSFLFRYRQQVSNVIDLNLQLMYKDMFWVGTSYRMNNYVAALFNIRVTEKIGVCYSYDFPTNKSTSLGLGSHELSVVFETSEFLKRNRDRRFGIKKKKSRPVSKNPVRNREKEIKEDDKVVKPEATEEKEHVNKEQETKVEKPVGVTEKAGEDKKSKKEKKPSKKKKGNTTVEEGEEKAVESIRHF